MKYKIGEFSKTGFQGSIIVNNMDYTSLEIGPDGVSTFYYSLNDDDLEERDISNEEKEPFWFFNLIFEEIEDL